MYELWLRATTLLLVSATVENEAAHHLQIEGPAVSRAEVGKLEDGRVVLHDETFSGVEMCSEKRPVPCVWKNGATSLKS